MGDPYAGLRRHVENGVQAAAPIRVAVRIAPVEPKRHPATGEAHGTRTRPESVHRKFSDELLAEMRAARESGESISAIARRFQVSRSHTSRILHGESRP
jgi:hypothetical protein